MPEPLGGHILHSPVIYTIPQVQRASSTSIEVVQAECMQPLLQSHLPHLFPWTVQPVIVHYQPARDP